MAQLVPCLIALRSEFNSLAPARDKASDGWIGDLAHQKGSSDHSPDDTPGIRTPSSDADTRPEVHAIDVDVNLRRSGWTMQRAVECIVLRHRSGADDRLQNVIYNRRIWSRSWGWTARAYRGPNPHDKHAHFGARYTTAQENDTSPWGLLAADIPPVPIKPRIEEFAMATKAEVQDAVEAAVAKAVPAAVQAALETVRPYQTGGPGKRLTAAGWSPLSMRGMTEYLLEDAAANREAGAAELEAFRQDMRATLERIAADPGNTVQLDPAGVQAVVDGLAAKLPNPAVLARAVNDDAALRMQG